MAGVSPLGCDDKSDLSLNLVAISVAWFVGFFPGQQGHHYIAFSVVQKLVLRDLIQKRDWCMSCVCVWNPSSREIVFPHWWSFDQWQCGLYGFVLPPWHCTLPAGLTVSPD